MNPAIRAASAGTTDPLDGTRPLRVVVADDSLLARAGVTTLLAAEPGFEVCGEAATFDELLAAVDATQPDAVVTDIRMPPTGTDEGIRAARRLRETHASIGVVVLSHYSDAAYALALMESGSEGRAYLLKEHVADPAHLCTALHRVADGGAYVDPGVVEELVAFNGRRRQRAIDLLTSRELEVLAEVASGKSNAAIAAAVYVGERAVEKHINSIFAKLGLSDDGTSHRRVKAVLLYLAEAST